MAEKKTYRLSGGLFDREEETSDVKRLFFLSVEGESTEPSYFINLNRVLKELGVDDAALHVLRHRKDGLSSPEDVYLLLEECRTIRDRRCELLPLPVIDRLREEFSTEEIEKLMNGSSDVSVEKFKRFQDVLVNLGINLNYYEYLKSAPSAGDRFVVVIDRDVRSHTRECLDEIIRKCRDNAYLCCLTNPCFEFWLLLHLADVDGLLEPDELQKIQDNVRVSKRHTYVSGLVSRLARHYKHINEHTFDRYYGPCLGKATKNAQKFAVTEEAVLDEVGTTMPRLIKEIFNGRLPAGD